MELAESSSKSTLCEVCVNSFPRMALDLGAHPMCDDLVPIGDDRVCKEYPIEILFCEVCRTAHQRFQIPKRELFPATYHYRSRHTADVLNGMRDLVSACEESLGSLAGKKVLDIGCNDGSLLSFFVEKGSIAFGIEPTGAAADASERGYTITNDFFSEAVAEDFVRRHGHPDLVTFTNVFAHIEDLKSVIQALKIVCHPRTLIVIENHYLGAILEKNQFDTFYHEHPRTYSYTSFVHIAKSLGRKIVRAEFPKRYGGNIRIFLNSSQESSGVDEGQLAISKKEEVFGQQLDQLSEKISLWKTNKLEEIRHAVAQHGPIRAKAFPGRAAIPIKMLGLTVADLSSAYEKPGSAKIGHYVPGTRIPIKSDDDFDLDASVEAPLLNLAWHISEEISTYLRRRGYKGRIIDIISPDDFLKTR
jgi:SAM-dependent methyltransferase